MLSAWPVPVPRAWRRLVNEPQKTPEEEALRRCVRRGQQFGSPRWQEQTAARLGLETTFRPRGRQSKAGGKGSWHLLVCAHYGF